MNRYKLVSNTGKRQIEKSILKIETIDKKIKPLNDSADAIVRTSGFGQAPPVYHRTLDKIIALKEKQAKIWNDELRNKSPIFMGETLWQKAVKSKLPVVRFGRETILNFSGVDIRTLLTEVKP